MEIAAKLRIKTPVRKYIGLALNGDGKISRVRTK